MTDVAEKPAVEETATVLAGDFTLMIDLTVGNPGGTLYGEHTSSERAAVIGILHQVAQKIGSGSEKLTLKNAAGATIASWEWSEYTVTGAPEGGKLSRDAPEAATAAVAYADEEAEDEEEDARKASSKKHKR